MEATKKVVIVGGGFGGLHLVRRLARGLRPGEAEVTLVDRRNYSLFTPLLYQVATGELPSHAVAAPLRHATAPAAFRFLQSEVEAIDAERRLVVTADGPLPYDHVVIAPGSVTTTYGIPGADRYALPIKELADALAVRHAVLSSFERAAAETDAARKKALLAFIIVGAGPVGVELASSLRDLFERTLRPMFPQLDLDRDTSIVLIDGSERVLGNMDQRLAWLAQRTLDRQRVRVVPRTYVAEVLPGSVRTRDGARFDAKTIIWAGGVTTNPLVVACDLVKASDKRLLVDHSFRVGGRDDVLALGDAAHFLQDSKPLPQLAQVAVLQAPAVARNLVHLLRGESPVPYRHREKGDLIALGRTSAGAKLGNVVFGGLLAWTVWRGYYLLRLSGARGKATLLSEWILSYFFSRTAADTP
ncbi:MAG: NAD(P)/FAD-dependent oxidoreductase [Chloroflexi bacterium]|nr:NAD(P)/FAD-dependent oxidoreductase [Chloroflexota bacterium]